MQLHTVRVGDSSIIEVDGELDAAESYSLYLTAMGETEQGSTSVVFELSAVSFIDSVGLGMLVRSHDELAAAGAAMVISKPSESVTRLLDMTALTQHFTVEPG